MIALMETCLPEMASRSDLRPELLALLKDVDHDGNGHLDFDDFLRVLRKWHNKHHNQCLAKEKRAVEETHFSPHEVHEFRQLSLSYDEDQNRELSLAEFKQMIQVICPMGEKNSAAISAKFKEISAMQWGVNGSREELDFPEFLWFLKHLFDINFGGIQDRAALWAKP